MTEEQTIENLNLQIRCVSHEVRNHLSICDMYSEIIKKNLEKSGIENPSINNALECIQQSIQVISANILDLKSLNNTTPQILDFESLAKRGAELGKAYASEKEIEFEIFIKNSAMIYVDENRILACIVNIIKNGIESIEFKGKIEVLGEIKDNKAILKISNNGKPIPKDKQKNIFTEGYTTKKTGCGLGLAICKKYMSENKASLELTKSTKDCTQFEITIPVLKTK